MRDNNAAKAIHVESRGTYTDGSFMGEASGHQVNPSRHPEVLMLFSAIPN
jgi:hypothetical protein